VAAASNASNLPAANHQPVYVYVAATPKKDMKTEEQIKDANAKCEDDDCGGC
jgi:hypothetical protein